MSWFFFLMQNSQLGLNLWSDTTIPQVRLITKRLL